MKNSCSRNSNRDKSNNRSVFLGFRGTHIYTDNNNTGQTAFSYTVEEKKKNYHLRALNRLPFHIQDEEEEKGEEKNRKSHGGHLEHTD